MTCACARTAASPVCGRCRAIVAVWALRCRIWPWPMPPGRPSSAGRGGIIADVPCSGLGVLARRPDLRRRPRTALAEHADLQRAILKALAARLEPGAELAYITCTLHPLENEQAVDWLLAEDSGLERLVQWQTPHDHPWLEGMFAAPAAAWVGEKMLEGARCILTGYTVPLLFFCHSGGKSS